VATGNHYVIDVLAGVGIVLGAHVLVDRAGRVWMAGRDQRQAA
jgi:hypothetical protein